MVMNMYERIRNMYLFQNLSENGLDNAVKKGWITADEAISLREEKESM